MDNLKINALNAILTLSTLEVSGSYQNLLKISKVLLALRSLLQDHQRNNFGTMK